MRKLPSEGKNCNFPAKSELVYVYVYVCLCVYVSVSEGKKERERERENMRQMQSNIRTFLQADINNTAWQLQW